MISKNILHVCCQPKICGQTQERNVRIESKSILESHFITSSINACLTQPNARPCIYIVNWPLAGVNASSRNATLVTRNVGNYLKSMNMRQKPYGPHYQMPESLKKFEVSKSSEIPIHKLGDEIGKCD